MYKIIKYFTDLQDQNHPYNVGDTFPREGLEVTKERLEELAGSENVQGVPLIEKVVEKNAPAKRATKKAPAKREAASEK